MERIGLSITEAAQALGVAESTIRKAIAAGTLPATKLGVGRGRWVIARKALEDLLCGQRVE